MSAVVIVGVYVKGERKVKLVRSIEQADQMLKDGQLSMGHHARIVAELQKPFESN